jgi:hypothetical protein
MTAGRRLPLPTREQVRTLLAEGYDYRGAASQLGIPPGQAYLIATGRPAGGSGSPARQEQEGRPGWLLVSSQHLANPPHENPSTAAQVREWIAARVAADGQMLAAAARRTAAPQPPPEPEASLDLADVLTRQHNQVRALQERLAALPGHRAGGTEADLAARKSLVDMIIVRLSGHETAEEEHLWPAVRAALPDGGQWAERALAQEQEGRDLLAELGRLDPGTDEFDERVDKLVAALRRHIACEEEVFLLLRAAMPEEERERLGRKLQRAASRGPTPPHRRSPEKPSAPVTSASPGAAAPGKPREAGGGTPAQEQERPE